MNILKKIKKVEKKLIKLTEEEFPQGSKIYFYITRIELSFDYDFKDFAQIVYRYGYTYSKDGKDIETNKTSSLYCPINKSVDFIVGYIECHFDDEDGAE